jgi:hypothetical protein
MGHDMACEVIELIQGVVSIKLTGELQRADLDQIHTAAHQAVEHSGKVRVHVVVENFKGFDGRFEADAVHLKREQSRQIKKIAIIGDDKGRDVVYRFLVDDFPATAIGCFTPAERARAIGWLTEDL